MTSRAQIEANRRNATHSTGPKTQHGKLIARSNALKHGFLSQNLFLKDESPKEFKQLMEEMHEALCPEGILEEMLVEKIVSAYWRKRRLIQAEIDLLGRKEEYMMTVLGSQNTRVAFMGDTGNAMINLSRYESVMEKSFYRALHELQRLQGMRLGQPVMAPPIAIEVNIDEGSKGPEDIEMSQL